MTPPVPPADAAIVRRRLLFLLPVPLLAGLFNIVKVLTTPACMAFDFTDDANHTFVNHAAVQALLRRGELPLMNLLNNFGTPLIGDAVTLPFSLLAPSYWLLPFDVAMTVNRFLVTFLTVLLLTVYYRKIMSPFAATISAVLAFYTPTFVWQVAHHPYQATLLCLTAILLLQDRFARSTRGVDFFFLCMAFVVLFLSVTINVVVIVVAFVIGHQLVSSRFRVDGATRHLLLAIVAGALFSYPDTLAFGTNIRASLRIIQGYEGAHLPTVNHLFVPVVSLAVLALLRKVQGTGDRLHRDRVLLLGLLPTLAVAAMINYPALWQALPLLRSTDITRFWFVSNVFVVAGAGTALDGLRNPGRQSRLLAVLMGCLCLVEAVRSGMLAPWSLPVVLVAAALVLAVIGVARPARENAALPRRFAVVAFVLIGILVCVSPLATAHQAFGYSDLSVCRPDWVHHFSPRGSDRFHPQELVAAMAPVSRVAVEAPSWLGFDLKILRDGMLGSGGRSIIVNAKFARYLLDQGLVAMDQIPAAYHFKRDWDADKLSRLGIRYVIQRGPDNAPAPNDWRLVANAQGLYLYENLRETGVVYLLGPHQTVRPLGPDAVDLRGNGLHIRLPAIDEPRELVATFVALPGWRAQVDGRESRIRSSDDQLIRLTVGPGDRAVSLTFAPFGWPEVLSGPLLSLLIPALVWPWCRRRARDAAAPRTGRGKH